MSNDHYFKSVSRQGKVPRIVTNGIVDGCRLLLWAAQFYAFPIGPESNGPCSTLLSFGLINDENKVLCPLPFELCYFADSDSPHPYTIWESHAFLLAWRRVGKS